jgi:dTDP-4-amino-4,6-dideoxygalactose transaminase
MKINVTKTYLPPLQEYNYWLNKIWANEWLTNRGELVLELEKRLKDYLKIKNILITNNGTIPIQIALKVLCGKDGEVITTPFSYVATSASISWEGLVPIFTDIDKNYLTIDEAKIEEKISKKTKAILATHVFGNPCNIEAINEIAKKHNLKVIYDAAHCFAVKYKDQSIFRYGDVSTCSFHATKLFHTAEGGAIFSENDELMYKFFYSHNFGHQGAENFIGLGINGKISELQAAMGLSVLPYVDDIIMNRKKSVELYNNLLINTGLDFLKLREGTQWNYSYYPVVFSNEQLLLKVKNELNANDIFPRRYFYPSLNNLPYLDYAPCPVSENISKCILCLPLYYNICHQDIENICKIIIKHL